MAKYAQIEVLKSGEIFRVVEETDDEVYFYDEYNRWSYFKKSERNILYHYTPAGKRRTPRTTTMPCGRKHSEFIWCGECHQTQGIK